MRKRKDNLKTMEKRVQMNLDTSKDMEMSDKKSTNRGAKTPKEVEMSE